MSGQKSKHETIKVCLRTRPLLVHEDLIFWVADDINNTFYTVK
jgi:hypothetical protein